jgi:PAS domain S-box-containing protein
MDADLRFTYTSGNVERILGVPPKWHYGKTREELLGDDYDRETWDQHLQTLRNREPFRNFEYRHVGAGIEPIWLRINGIPKFTEDGAFLGYRGIASDITEKKRADENLHASEIRLLHAQKMQSIGRLTGGVAHDFNNLLAVIQGNFELIEERVVTAWDKRSKAWTTLGILS